MIVIRPPNQCARCKGLLHPQTRGVFCGANPECKRLMDAARMKRYTLAKALRDPPPTCRECGASMRRKSKAPACTRTASCRAAVKRWRWKRSARYRANQLASARRYYRANKAAVKTKARNYYERARAVRLACGLNADGSQPKRKRA